MTIHPMSFLVVVTGIDESASLSIQGNQVFEIEDVELFPMAKVEHVSMMTLG